MKAQPAHAEPMPVPQCLGRDARIGDGDAAQAAAEARERIEHDAVVVAVRIALHHHAVGEAERSSSARYLSTGAGGGV